MRSLKFCCSAALFFLTLCGHTYESERLKAERSFPEFCKNWVETLNKYAQDNIACKRMHDRYVAEYANCSNDYAFEVKKPASGGNSFVGTLQLREAKYQSCAQSCEGARQGPFTLSTETNVTHIFLYRNGRWQY